MDTFTDMEMFGIEQEAWLRKFMPLTNGIPSHDTFGDVFAVIEPFELTRLFSDWVETIRKRYQAEVVAIDGKSICASKDIPKNKRAIHVVSAFATQNGLILGEMATSEKSNEITAILELLKMLEIKGCIVTIDAMGTQTNIAQAIIDKGADYVLPVKENQPQLHNDIKEFFDDAPNNLEAETTSEVSHGRLEKRSCEITKDISWLDPDKRWANLSGIARITSRTENLSDHKISTDIRYLIFSGKDFTAADVLSHTRAHWGVESMHWRLDVAFREDSCRVRERNAGKVFNILRHFTLNLLTQEKTSKGGIASKRMRCAISPAYRKKVLGIL
jgi:predicted transposase YbfD/YdcC